MTDQSASAVFRRYMSEDDDLKRRALLKLYTATAKAEARQRVESLRRSRNRQGQSLYRCGVALGYAKGYLHGRFAR